MNAYATPDFTCLTLAVCSLDCPVEKSGPIDNATSIAWHKTLTGLAYQAGEPWAPSWGTIKDDTDALVLFIAHGAEHADGHGQCYNLTARSPYPNLQIIENKLLPLQPYMSVRPKLLTMVIGNDGRGSSSVARSGDEVMDIFEFDFAQSGNDSTSHDEKKYAGLDFSFSEFDLLASSTNSKAPVLKTGARLQMTDAYRWLSSGPSRSCHDGDSSPLRGISQIWTGQSLETHAAMIQGSRLPIDSEVLIIGWRSWKRRDVYMQTPDSRGQGWTDGFERPVEALMSSGDLRSIRRWTIEKRFQETTIKPISQGRSVLSPQKRPKPE